MPIAYTRTLRFVISSFILQHCLAPLFLCMSAQSPESLRRDPSSTQGAETDLTFVVRSDHPVYLPVPCLPVCLSSIWTRLISLSSRPVSYDAPRLALSNRPSHPDLKGLNRCQAGSEILCANLVEFKYQAALGSSWLQGMGWDVRLRNVNIQCSYEEKKMLRMTGTI